MGALKYTDARIVFRELPDEVTLAVNISNCPCRCPGCHSPYLSQDVGEVLDEEAVRNLLTLHAGITAICLMGGDADSEAVAAVVACAKRMSPSLKTGWYSGRDVIAPAVAARISCFDYIKVGRYDAAAGPLDNPHTNQRLYRVNHEAGDALTDITGRFWRKSVG